MDKTKVLYFGVFIIVAFALVFHLTAMGHNHWKVARAKENTPNAVSDLTVTIGIFRRCSTFNTTKQETCGPNLFPRNYSCGSGDACDSPSVSDSCQCDYLPSTKGIASCTIIAAVFLGLALIVLFIHSINTSQTKTIGLVLGCLPLLFLILTFAFILTALILVGSYLSRDMMEWTRFVPAQNQTLDDLRETARNNFDIQIGWTSGLEIIALILTFFSIILYGAFIVKFGRSN